MLAAFRQYVVMRTRIPITAEEVLEALERAQWDVKAAASALDVNERTLYRRMRDYGIKRRIRYGTGEAA